MTTGHLASTQIQTLAALPPTLAAASSGSDRPALVVRDDHGDESITYRDLDLRSAQVASALARAGVRPGDRVAAFAPDSLRLFVALFGVARAGGVFVPASWRLGGEELGFILADAKPTLVFTTQQHETTVNAVLAAAGLQPPVVLLDRPDKGGTFDAWSSVDPRASDPPVGPESTAVQIYTSGTTGHPKGVELPHRSFFALAREIEKSGGPWLGWTRDDVSLLFVPTFHIGGLWWLVRSLHIGSTNIVHQGFRPQRVLEEIQRSRVARVGMVPAMMQLLLAEPGCERTDFSSLKSIVYGGSPCHPQVLRNAAATFKCDLCQIYGMTETGNMAVSLAPEDHVNASDQRLRSAGRPLPGVSVRVVRDTGELARAHEIGEIHFRSPAQMIGYHDLPEQTRNTLVDGWVKSGDAGYVDEDGFVYVCDRIKDMVICGGEKVFPAEIERILREHPAVADVAVIGVPDETWGEAVHAVVVRRASEDITTQRLRQYARGRLADFKVPRTVEFIDQLPRNPSGKVLKRVLQEAVARSRARGGSSDHVM